MTCQNHGDQNEQESKVVVVENCKLPSNIHSGDTLLVKLIQYPGRGYFWSLKIKPTEESGVLFIKEYYVDSSELMDDSSQAIFFKFLVKENASFLLEFEYSRPWEKDKIPSDECRLLINTS